MNADRAHPTAEPRSGLSAVPRIGWLAAGLAALLVAAIAAGLWQLRRDTLSGQARELSVLTLALAAELERGLQGVELALQATRLELRDGRLPLQSDDTTALLHARALQLPLVRKLWVVDAQGKVLAASGSAPAPAPDSFSPTLAALGDDGAALSRPFQDMTGHETVVAMAVRFAGPAAGPAATPGGWVLAEMPAEALRGAFNVASPAADARMAVYRADGARLAGALTDAPSLPEPAVAERLSQDRIAEIRTLSDGNPRLFEARTLSRYGVKLVVTRNLRAVLAPWREVAELATLGLVLTLGLLGVAARVILRTEQRQRDSERALQAQRSRTGKLESLGTLAGGVAHDFNNVLAAVLGFAEMARQAAPEHSAQARHLDNVLRASLRGKALVERILAFSRSGAQVSQVFAIRPIVDEVLILMAASLKPGIQLVRELQDDALNLRGDPTQVFEAVMNLCNNAVQALPNGGTVALHLRRSEIGAAQLFSHGRLAPGAYAVLSVRDDGAGITPEVMERLFEPFFTTRGRHAGTGLGLAVVHGVVAELGGAIDVRSPPGEGAHFTLYLPLAEGEVTAPSPALAEPPLGEGQTLLVLDDDPALTELAEEMLAELGYDPVPFNDPQAALAALLAEPQRFDGVITDEVMPGLSGTQFTEALRRAAPELPVLMVSGYGGPQLSQRAAAAGVTRLLAKPLQRAELARALAQVLAR